MLLKVISDFLARVRISPSLKHPGQIELLAVLPINGKIQPSLNIIRDGSKL